MRFPDKMKQGAGEKKHALRAGSGERETEIKCHLGSDTDSFLWLRVCYQKRLDIRVAF